MKKINIAELLKDCPTGMELDCTICDNVYFDEVTPYLIKCFIKNDTCNTIYFHHDGAYLTNQNAKCVIFPKGKITWEGFQRPFKDGDILTTALGNVFILKESNENIVSYGCYVALQDVSYIIVNSTKFCVKEGCRLATEEEKQKLFDAIKANGYKWNPETKTLEKLIEPKFKMGDKIQWIDTDYKPSYVIKSLEHDRYMLDNGNYMNFGDEKFFKLLKFDIFTLKPFDKVLVRYGNNVWHIHFFEKYDKSLKYPFVCMNGNCYKQCIPYENNEHLLDTTNDCNDFYKTWE